ncbi:MAG: hypothetical protein V4609_09230 [Pseudomonadota bacterium]
MTDVTENDLRAAVKALTDVIAPAISKADPLALEQLRLVTESLEFIRSRLDDFYDRDYFDLNHHLEMARLLQAMSLPLTEPTQALLGRTVGVGDEVSRTPGASSRDLKTATAGLAAAVRLIVRESTTMPADRRDKVERCVLSASRSRIAVDRAWFLPMGFDPEPDKVSPLSDVLGPRNGDQRCLTQAAQ